MILKTYAMLITGGMNLTLFNLQALITKHVDLRFKVQDLEIATVGDFCIIAAPQTDM